MNVGISNTVADVGNYVADKRGYFKAEGMSVRFVAFDAAALMIAPMASGELDVGAGGVSAGLFNAVVRGIHLKIVADKASSPPGLGGGAMMVRSELVLGDADATLRSLKGHTVAIPAQGTATSTAMDMMLGRVGMSLKDMQVTYLSFPAMISALQNKAVDSAFLAEPGMTTVIDLGVAKPVVRDDEMFPNHEIAVTLYSENFARDHRDTAVRYMRALLRGVRDYTDAVRDGHLGGPDAEAIVAILTEYSLIKDANLYRRIRMPICDPNGHVNLDSLNKDLAYFVAQGLIKGDVKLSDVVDASIAADAVRGIGPYVAKQ